MPLLQIRDVPDEARRALKAKAAARGQSLNSYLLDLIERDAARPTVVEVLARAHERSERASVSATEPVRSGRQEREDELAARITR